MPPILSRLLSPSGFMLALLLLLLPFVGVSCSDEELGGVDGVYTGFDLVTGGAPDYEASGRIADQTAIEQVVHPDPGVRVLAIILVVVLVAGIAAALLPVLRARTAAGAAIAGLAAALLVLTQLIAQSNLVDSMRELLLVNLFSIPRDRYEVITTDEYLSEATGTRAGFWLVLAVLLGVAAVNAVLSRTGARRPPAP